MRVSTIPCIAACLGTLASSAPARAQGTPHEHVAIIVGATEQLTSTTFGQSVTFEAYAEEGSIDTTYTISQALRFTAGGTVHR